MRYLVGGKIGPPKSRCPEMPNKYRVISPYGGNVVIVLVSDIGCEAAPLERSRKVQE
jgi:hypothetical protein